MVCGAYAYKLLMYSSHYIFKELPSTKLLYSGLNKTVFLFSFLFSFHWKEKRKERKKKRSKKQHLKGLKQKLIACRVPQTTYTNNTKLINIQTLSKALLLNYLTNHL